ncbi:glutathione S-transferase [Polaromonas sp. P1-6]|nr:glutathione S-transferase [Polaromonas sp. P1-6]
MRARLAIAVSSQRCELREVVLKSKPPEMLAASPKGTVPVLVLPSGDVIDESLDIMLWALRRNDPEGWLTSQRGSLDAMQALIAENDGTFKQSLDRYKYPNRYPLEHSGDVQQFAQAHQAHGAGWLAGLEARLESGGWLLGSSASLADMAILPFVRQFAHTDTAWFAAQPWPHLLGWLGRWEASALYQSVMEKYPPWQAGNADVGFPPAAIALPRNLE